MKIKMIIKETNYLVERYEKKSNWWKRKLKELMDWQKNENDQLVKREMKTIEHDFNRKG